MKIPISVQVYLGVLGVTSGITYLVLSFIFSSLILDLWITSAGVRMEVVPRLLFVICAGTVYVMTCLCMESEIKDKIHDLERKK